MALFHLSVTTSAGKAFDGEAQRIIMRGAQGEFAVLADHAPFMTLVKPCICTITTENAEIKAQISSGVFQVADNKATLLVGKFEKDNLKSPDNAVV